MLKGIAIALLVASALAAGGRDAARTPTRKPEPPAAGACDEVEQTRREMAELRQPRPFDTRAAGRATDW